MTIADLIEVLETLKSKNQEISCGVADNIDNNGVITGVRMNEWGRWVLECATDLTLKKTIEFEEEIEELKSEIEDLESTISIKENEIEELKKEIDKLKKGK